VTSRRHTLYLALTAASLALSLAACVTRESETTIENRTTKDVVLVSGGNSYLIPACGRIVINESDGAKPLDPSAPQPPGSVVVRHELLSVPEQAVIATVTITSERIWTGGPFPSPAPCEGVPPTQPTG
jgi:hypothetical protein